MSEQTYKLYAVKLSAIKSDQLKDFEFSLLANDRYALVYTDKELSAKFVVIPEDTKITADERAWLTKTKVTINARYVEEHKDEILPELDNLLTRLQEELAIEQKKIGGEEMTDCRKCKHCVYTAHDYCGSGNKLISCDSKFEPTKGDDKNCKNYEAKKK